MTTIDHFNYKVVEEDLNKELQTRPVYESWMEFTIKLIEGSKDIYQITYMLPISSGITTEVSPAEAISLYKGIVHLVAPLQE